MSSTPKKPLWYNGFTFGKEYIDQKVKLNY
jgi:hypothetical protein